MDRGNRITTKHFVSMNVSLALLSACLILSSYALIFYFLLNQQFQSVRNQSRLYAETIINNFVQAVELSEFNQEWLQAFVVAVGTNPGLLHVAVLDDKGVIVAHSDPKQRGKTFPDQSMPPSRSTNMASYFLDDSSSESIVRVVSPVTQFSDENQVIRYVLADMELHDKLWDITSGNTVALLVGLLGLIAFNLFALTLFIRQRIIKRLRKLRRGSERIAGGIFTERIPVEKNDEVGQLASAFNSMAASLAETTVSRDFFDNILHSMADALFVLDADMNIIRVNKASQALLGYEERELLGTQMLDYVEYEGKKPDPHVCRLLDTPLDAMFCIAKDGRRIPVLISSSSFHGDSENRNIMICTVRDISELKRTEEILRHSEKSLKEAQQIAGLGNWTFDLITKNLYWSEEVYRIFEVDPDGFSPSYNVFLETVHPEDRDRVNKLFMESLSNNTPYEVNYRLRMHDGRVKYMHAHCDTYYDADGHALRSVGTVQDVTRNKMEELEKERLKGQLAQAQKMEAVGTLAGGIAHDFNNLLTVILGNTELSMLTMPEGSSAKNQLIQVTQAARRAKDLVDQILSFSRKDAQRFLPIQPATVVKEVIKLLRSTIPTTVEIRHHIEPDCGSMIADSSQIHQILMNLCTNAVHAMQESGVLEIRLEKTSLADHDLANHPEMTAGTYIKLSVSDSGSGMDKETLERIFDPFFTTKEVGKGTGMGLSVVHGIVAAHHGLITVDSKPGEGTLFSVYFPRTEIETPAPEEKLEGMPGGTERILIVDDEELIVDLWETALGQLGYLVTTKTSSPDALEIFSSRSQEFDLVITDQTMPRITGAELSKQLLKIRPDIPIIICTGYSSKITHDEAICLKVKRFMTKPIEIAQLAKAIREILDEKLLRP